MDLSFTTDQGVEQPQEFQGLVVAPGQLLTVNLGDHLRRRQAIATTVTARSGRLVAWKTEVVTPPTRQEAVLGTPAASAPFADPATPIAGVTVTLGLAAPALAWTWADGVAGNGVNERYVIYNPGADSAQLKLALLLEQGVAEPFDLSVGPEQVVTVVSSQEVRIPPGVGHAAVLQSLNGVPVVAERTVAAASPSSWSGLGALTGGQLAAPTLAAGSQRQRPQPRRGGGRLQPGSIAGPDPGRGAERARPGSADRRDGRRRSPGGPSPRLSAPGRGRAAGGERLYPGVRRIGLLWTQRDAGHQPQLRGAPQSLSGRALSGRP